MISSERRFLSIVCFSVLLITTMPYLFAYLSAPDDRHFMGILWNVPDHAQYLSWFREFQTRNLIENKLTPEPNDPIFFNLLWWITGRFGHLTGLGFPVLHQLLRLFAGVLFFGAAYAFCARALPEPRVRRIAFLLVALASGFGWVLVLLKYTVTRGVLLFPLDVYIAEPNSFLCIMAFPHFVLACGLILSVFLLVLVASGKGQLRYSFAAGIVGLLLGLQHAYDLLILYGVVGMYTFLVAIRDRRFPWFLAKTNVVIWLISLWPGFYALWLTRANPIWKEVLAQFANAGVYTPSPFHLIVLMGLPLLLAALTFDGLLSADKNSDELLFVKGWFLVGFLLLYVPTDFQVHMLNSWQVPVSILAARGLFFYILPVLVEYVAHWRPRWEAKAVVRSIAFGLVFIASLTNLYLFAWRFVDLARYDYPYYLRRDDLIALEWLERNTIPQDVVLSSYTLGHFIPALSGNTAFLAHWAQTVNFYDKRDRVKRFFESATPDVERAETLRAFGVDYIFYGSAERSLGGYDPGASAFLSHAFSAHDVSVYRVDRDKLSQTHRSNS